jgi:flavin reductase (DIM6/NTAB) family NADH-FMN oxidoreductase RutF
LNQTLQQHHLGVEKSNAANEATAADKPSSTLRSALGAFATGVTIVTARNPQGEPVGLTCNSFAALSLSPPLVTWALQAASPSRTAFEQASHFAVNVLSNQQRSLAERFAKRSAQKFDGVALTSAHGLPFLHGAIAMFECKLVSAQVHGDHVLFIGEIAHFEQHPGDPLLFVNGTLQA